MVKFPEKFVERMKNMLGEAEFNEYVASFEKSYYSGLRVNNLKLTPNEFKELSSMELKEVPFIDNAFYYSDDDQPTKHPYYYAGLYYIQEPSAMTPANIFDVQPGDKVLDVCAAPGGKSTALAAKLQGEGILVSNDISNSRAKALLKNIELFGVKNAVVISESTNKLAQKFYGYFDKILVDAPCSGEGMFRKQPSIMNNWEQYGTEYYAKLQREILPDAIKMLKPGGKLLYSTCTFSPLEDEETVKFVLDNFPNMKLVDPTTPEHMEYLEKCGFVHGKKEWMEEPIDGIEKTIRLFPHKINGEGHFIAVFEKDAEVYEPMAPLASIKTCKIPKEAKEFLDELRTDIDYKNIELRDNRLYMIPKGLPDITGLRILRNGLLLGEVKKERFEPSQALACALKANEFNNVYNLSCDDEDVRRYLKCESIELKSDVKDGYALVTVDNYPLGFIKVKKGNVKNKYLPGWRMM